MSTIGADITQIFSLDVVDGAGVGHSGEQIVEMCEVAGWDGQITLTLSLHLISVQKILHWEHSTLHTQRHLLVDEWITVWHALIIMTGDLSQRKQLAVLSLHVKKTEKIHLDHVSPCKVKRKRPSTFTDNIKPENPTHLCGPHIF